MAAQRRTRAKRREGAVLVEAVVAIGSLLLLLAAAWFAHAVYAHRIDTLYEARKLAWGGTHPECMHDGTGEPEPVRVQAPPQLGDLAVDVRVVTRFACNERPGEHGDLLAVLEWAIGAGEAGWEALLDLVDSLREG